MKKQERIASQARKMTEEQIQERVDHYMNISQHWNEQGVRASAEYPEVAEVYYSMCREASHEAAMWVMA